VDFIAQSKKLGMFFMLTGFLVSGLGLKEWKRIFAVGKQDLKLFSLYESLQR